MIYYLTEDKFDSPFVKLFNSAYSKAVLECAGSNGNLESHARYLAKRGSGGNRVIVYMDVVPDNLAVLPIYNALLDLYRVEKLEVVVLPVVCAEYAFICSVQDIEQAFFSKVGLHEILSKSSLYKSSELAVKHSMKSSKAFERFCKLFCRECLSEDCCSVADNSHYSSSYFLDKCNCSGCQMELSLFEKSVRLLTQYPVVPDYGSDTLTLLEWESVVECSYRLVDEYNMWASTFDGYTVRLRKRCE